MAVIHELDAHMADLIAAGEVVERPSSVCKELVENAIDAGATQVTVELENGGVTYLRVCDNGCGMESADAVTAFRRHATSKIRTKEDLATIGTLGFRGEALAAISAVSHVDLFTKQKGALEGTHLNLAAGNILVNEPAGCAEGTTFIIRDLFYNTPARMKFLKKDFTEAGYVVSAVEHAAESHPEISFRVLRDGKQVFHSPGNGSVKNAVFAVFGRQLSEDLMEVPEYENNGIRVSGYISKPHAPRSNRTYQHFFVNGRFVKSKLIQAALEEAYRNKIITGKFPYGCLYLTLPLGQVDVNVHPAKTEVKFALEKPIFSAVYAACKNAIDGNDNIPELKPKAAQPKAPEPVSAPASKAPEPPRSTPVRSVFLEHSDLPSFQPRTNQTLHQDTSPLPLYDAPPLRPVRRTVLPFVDVDESDEEALEGETPRSAPVSVETQSVAETDTEEKPENMSEQVLAQATAEVRVIGECFDTYIIAEDADGLILIDKHAAHERLIFNELRVATDMPTQMLLAPVVADLAPEEYAAVMEGAESIRAVGFALEPFGQHSVAVREIPAYLEASDVPAVLSEMAQKLMDRRTPVPDRLDDLIHTVSCKAAIKGGRHTSEAERQDIVRRVLGDPEVSCCPHGRPTTIRLTKYELDKLFKRVNQ